MEKINNIFNLEKQNIYPNDNNLPATLNQGLQFKKYQDKITSNIQTKKIEGDLEEENATAFSGFHKLTNEQPSNIVEGFDTSGQTPAAQKAALLVLQGQYNTLIQQYNTEKQNLLSSTNNYINGISTSSNPYLNRNIKTTTNGKSYYITGEGVAKLYSPSTISPDYSNIMGINNCPSTTQTITGTMPSYINTANGTPMVVGQQCGNEGKNVVVNTIIDDKTTNYIGCYNDALTSPAMSAVDSGKQNYDFTTCKQAAIDTNNLYFGLQNLNPTTGKSSCYTSNDLAKSTKYLASTTICKSDTDGYIYGAKSVNAIYNSPDTTYIGLFKDTPQRAMTKINDGSSTFTYDTCKLEAANRNKKYFGLQKFNTTTQKSQCFVGDAYSTISKYGTSTDSYTGTSDGKIYGDQWTNSVYKIDTKQSDYIGCYNDVESSPAMTNVTNANNKSNYSFAECQKQAIGLGKKYFALQGGKKGSSKCFVSDDLTESQKYGIYIPCVNSPVTGDTNKYGLLGNNAIYRAKQVGVSSYMGKIGYVDGNSKLHEYPNSMIIPGPNYTKTSGYDSNSTTKKMITNTTAAACKIACTNDTSNSYYGFTFDNSTKIGYLKGNSILNPSLKKLSSNMDLYIRDVKTSGANASCNKNTVPINTTQWKNYSNGANVTPNMICGLENANSSQNTKIANLEKQIKSVSGKIITILNSLNKQSDSVKNKIGINSRQIETDLTMYSGHTDDIRQYYESKDNMINIINDTNLLVLYKNYNYMFWSILAITTIIISMKMAGK